MRISSHGRASKRGRKTLCNVCAVAILGVLVIANRDRAVYVGRAHASTAHNDGETRVHAICIHDVSDDFCKRLQNQKSNITLVSRRPSRTSGKCVTLAYVNRHPCGPQSKITLHFYG
ncbi:uncharacterized protein [Polyergus mexicanus]|uniref:uncharacterized protein n=1 Tax=Polyergus mexicanus TaxID=615972 RepID=UPI0038B5E675